MPRHRRPDPSSARSWIALLALCCAAGAAGPLLAQPLSAGPEIQVNSYTTGLQGVPRVASTPDGAFVVAWGSFGSIGPDDDGSSVQVRRYDADGEPLGNQLQVNAYTTGTQWYPDVWLRGDGQFVVTWQTQFSAGDPSGSSIQARRYSANGTPLGGQFQVNTYTTGDATSPRVAGDVAGNFVVVSGRARLVWGTAERQTDADGDFTIVWESQGSFRDNSGLSVQSRWYKRDGSAWGDQLQINFWTMSQQDWPVVSSDALGDVVVVWQSVGSYGTDSDNRSVQARLYDGLFRDGFELGDTLRWSDVMP